MTKIEDILITLNQDDMDTLRRSSSLFSSYLVNNVTGVKKITKFMGMKITSSPIIAEGVFIIQTPQMKDSSYSYHIASKKITAFDDGFLQDWFATRTKKFLMAQTDAIMGTPPSKHGPPTKGEAIEAWVELIGK